MFWRKRPVLRNALICGLQRAEQAIVTPVFKIGGCPVLYEETEWPVCDSCDSEMDFLAQISLKDPMQLSRKFDMAYAFMCPADSDCETWDPWSGSNCVILQRHSENAYVGTRRATPDFGSYPDYKVTFSESAEPDVDTADVDVASRLRTQVSSETKIGGVPAWIQSNESPTCPECGGDMAFIAQLKAELDGQLPADRGQWENYHTLKFGDVGLGYLFLCKDECCADGAAFLWQC
ncbi:MAG: hypothetical protein CMJ78_17195 [Planctomycetaceae bacterium]|nr:hypothetical protein [Planctomycetaceae bacterium]